MIVTVEELVRDSGQILNSVIQGEIVEVQLNGRPVAEIRPKVGATRSEVLNLLRGRGFNESDSRELRTAINAASNVLGYTGLD